MKAVKPSPDSKMIKLLTFDNLFPPLRHSHSKKLEVKWRRLSRFPAKMTLVHAWATLSILENLVLVVVLERKHVHLVLKNICSIFILS